MRTALLSGLCLVMVVEALHAEQAQVKPAASKITHVTVYQNTALVTREVAVPDGVGQFEVVVSPLPAATLQSSLYAEGNDVVRILSTRYRSRPIFEDTREEVRKLEKQLKTLQQSVQRIQSDLKSIELNLQLLTKMESFTAAGLKEMTDKGQLSSEQILKIADYVTENRTKKIKEQIALQQQLADSQEEIQFTERRLREASAGVSRTERDAVIYIDKLKADGGKVRLNYLVGAVTWRPQYKFRAGREKEPITVEYLAAMSQQTGEDWTGVTIALSTATPQLNSAPPDLKSLEVAVIRTGDPNVPIPPGFPSAAPGRGSAGQIAEGTYIPGDRAGIRRELADNALKLRQQSVQSFNAKNPMDAGKFANEAAALEQYSDLLAEKEEIRKQNYDVQLGLVVNPVNDLPSVTYHLKSKNTLPSRADEQVLEIARLELAPEYVYKAVPVLTNNVYRLANLVNKSDLVLLPGEATMYLGSDFVGQSQMPLIAIGRQFTVGLGIDPQLQVARVLIDKGRTTQGGNQVLKFDYRIYLNSYKTAPVDVQVWDRLPQADRNAIAITLTAQKPELSSDPIYQRDERTKNLLRWDVKVQPTQNGEKALTIDYTFTMELEKAAAIGAFLTK